MAHVFRQIWRDLRDAVHVTAMFMEASLPFALAYLGAAAVIRWTGQRFTGGWESDLAGAAVIFLSPALLSLCLLVFVWVAQVVSACRSSLTKRRNGAACRDSL